MSGDAAVPDQADAAGALDEVEDPARAVLLDAVEELFYERGYQAVGMAEVRRASGLPLKRIYALFPGKEAMEVAMLDRRDHRWMGALRAHVEAIPPSGDRVAAVFGWLETWLAGPGHRGCAWINAFGELGGTSEVVTAAVRRHKETFRAYLAEQVRLGGGDEAAARAVFLLAEGAMVTAGITGEPTPARDAGAAAHALLAAAPTG